MPAMYTCSLCIREERKTDTVKATAIRRPGFWPFICTSNILFTFLFVLFHFFFPLKQKEKHFRFPLLNVQTRGCKLPKKKKRTRKVFHVKLCERSFFCCRSTSIEFRRTTIENGIKKEPHTQSAPYPHHMVSASDLLRSALDQLLQLPKVPKSLLMWLPFVYFFFPLVAAFESARICLTLTVSAFVSSVVEFLVEWSQRRRDTVKLEAASRAVRERFDALWRYVVDSARWMVLAAMIIWFGLPFFTAFLTLYVIYLIAFQRHHSFLTSLLKRLVRRALGLPEPAAAAATGAEQGSKRSPPVADRTTSLKGGSHTRCKVVDEGPRFNKRSRGSLISS